MEVTSPFSRIKSDMLGEPQNKLIQKEAEKQSNCCSAPIIPNTDFCSICKDHCSPVINCPYCEGTGEMNVPNGEDDFDVEKCDCSEGEYIKQESGCEYSDYQNAEINAMRGAIQ